MFAVWGNTYNIRINPFINTIFKALVVFFLFYRYFWSNVAVFAIKRTNIIRFTISQNILLNIKLFINPFPHSPHHITLLLLIIISIYVRNFICNHVSEIVSIFYNYYYDLIVKYYISFVLVECVGFFLHTSIHPVDITQQQRHPSKNGLIKAVQIRRSEKQFVIIINNDTLQ